MLPQSPKDCFQDTDWKVRKRNNLQEYTETIIAYIKKCTNDVTVIKTITTQANQKPWLTVQVRGMLKNRDYAFRSGDKVALRANLSHGINQAKQLYAPPTDQVSCLSSFTIRKTLSRINLCKAGSPDNIPGHVIRDLRLLN